MSSPLASNQTARLLIRTPVGKQEVYPLGRATTVGRHPENIIVLNDECVSGHHAEIIFAGDGYTLRDNNSTNGTTVNRQSIKEVRLSNGDVIHFGSVEARFADTTRAHADTRTPSSSMHPSIRQHQVALLIESLQRMHRTDERKNAAVELEQLGSIAASAAPQLVLATTDIDADVRTAAGKALTAIDPEWKKRDDVRTVIPLLIVKLGSTSAPVMNAAMRLLRQLGTSSTPFLTAFLDENPHKPTCVFILQLLTDLGREANVAVPAILKAMESEVMQVRLASARAFLRVADPKPEVIAALTTALGDEFSDIRAAAAETLTSFGIAARVAIRRLLVLLSDREDKVRAAASAALESIGPAVAPALVEVLNTRDQERMRVWGDELFQAFHLQPGWVNLSGLRNIAWTVADVVKARTNLELAHEAALTLLAKFGSDASIALASIPNTLKDPNPRVRLAAVNAIGSMGDEAAFAIPEIVPLLLDERDEIRVAAAKALCGIRESWAEDANIRAVLTAASGRTAVQAIEALVHGGSSSVPVLADFLNSPDRVLREQAAASLGRMGSKARGAIPHLEKALSDSHGWVQAAARTALQAITSSSSSLA